MPANSGTTAETITHGAYTSNTSITPATVSFPSKNPAHEERGGTGEPYLFEFGDAIRTVPRPPAGVSATLSEHPGSEALPPEVATVFLGGGSKTRHAHLRPAGGRLIPRHHQGTPERPVPMDQTDTEPTRTDPPRG